MTKSDLEKELNGKFVVFDTNILITSVYNTRAFWELFQFILKNNCAPVHFELIEFEFMRNAYTSEHRKPKEELINKINSDSMPINDKVIKEALEIANVYAHKKIQKGQISLVDCCIASYLKQYSSNLFLVTMNHKDFPVTLFDRLFIYSIDGGNDVFAPAFYRFNQKKWNKLKTDLEKAQ